MDEYLIQGPLTYVPRIEENVIQVKQEYVITDHCALIFQAIRDTKDANGDQRKAGEKWTINTSGSYMPSVDEEVVDFRMATVLDNKTALVLRATKTFTDVYGKDRKAGEEWLITNDMTEAHIQAANEENLGTRDLTVLDNRQYAYVLDPVDSEGVRKHGQRVLRKGPTQFFLNPGETLENGIEDAVILGENDSILVQARENYEESKGKTYKAGMVWMVKGPGEFIPQKEVRIVEDGGNQSLRQAIPLADNEGVYILNNKSGQVFLVKGPQTFTLSSDEQRWDKQLSPVTEKLLAQHYGGDLFSTAKQDKHGKLHYDKSEDASFYTRDKSWAIKFKAPHNSAVQLFDYKSKNGRIVFGPDVILLEPYEQISVIELSGNIPKKEGVFKNLALLLGPDFMRDEVVVETADHAQLKLMLAYRWHFDVDKECAKSSKKLFNLRDFIGDACKAMASRIRGVVSTVKFDQFHKNSSEIIRKAVFKFDADGKQKDFIFDTNNLHITSVDIQSVDPVDTTTRQCLQTSVNLSFEIQTQSLEASFNHQSARLGQESKGYLQRQQIKDEIECEIANKKLLELLAETNSAQTSGLAIAQAKADA